MFRHVTKESILWDSILRMKDDNDKLIIKLESCCDSADIELQKAYAKRSLFEDIVKQKEALDYDFD